MSTPTRPMWTCLYCGKEMGDLPENHNCPESDGSEERRKKPQALPPVDRWRIEHETQSIGNAGKRRWQGFVFDDWHHVAVHYRPWVEKWVCSWRGHCVRPFISVNPSGKVTGIERVLYEACYVCGLKRHAYLLQRNRWVASTDTFDQTLLWCSSTPATPLAVLKSWFTSFYSWTNPPFSGSRMLRSIRWVLYWILGTLSAVFVLPAFVILLIGLPITPAVFLPETSLRLVVGFLGVFAWYYLVCRRFFED